MARKLYIYSYFNKCIIFSNNFNKCIIFSNIFKERIRGRKPAREALKNFAQSSEKIVRGAHPLAPPVATQERILQIFHINSILKRKLSSLQRTELLTSGLHSFFFTYPYCAPQKEDDSVENSEC